jgi:hypothetical protein
MTPPDQKKLGQAWHQEDTDVRTDAQVFRALKEIHVEIEQNKLEAANAHGALKAEVVQLKDTVTTMSKAFDERLDKHGLMMERMAGQLDVLVPAYRQDDARAMVNEAVTEEIKKQDQFSTKKFKHDLALKLVGGGIAILTSGAFVALIVRWLS